MPREDILLAFSIKLDVSVLFIFTL
jgi:hypothetical protein